MDLNYSSKFDELLAKQFSEKLTAIKVLPIEQREHVLAEMLMKETSALQVIMDSYAQLTDEILDKLIYSIDTNSSKSDDPFSKAFLNVRKGDA